ncbi:hypothetical protein CMQ_2125 [Grosmannia clavigera kw1407]|uniref:Aminoglycoside phosphotransferase domain-containing protein n=1 Tax=Grosmannia clavigera (strain kw1407 / UAMH 11150) TaxID=655863 RepID=F0XJH6_GROCL|nr:uncharacterized protein CMQ_2125 [Grosmannia clavigera kw1407]EFX02076.1 hypothetical protein CMQ_2125 [Grosmannia clavigera kw1407]
MGADGQMTEQEVSWPPTNEQDAEAKQAFVDAIDPAAVCGLASRLGGGRACRTFQEPARGSFNVCFFVELAATDGAAETRWVVRVPIGPALHDVRAKVESEVATMRYVASKTTIPVTRVHGHGHDVALGRSPDDEARQCSFLVVDFVAGEPLDLAAFLDDTPARQHRLYSQLLDVLAQLRGLTFATGGSLMPGPDAGPEADPIVGPLQCTGYNELQRLTRGHTSTSTTLGPYRTAADFVLAQLHVLQAAFDVPMASASLANLRMEAFALHDLRGRLVDVLDQQGHEHDHHTFVLAHTDLRWSNIIVDEHLTIRGIIDWEWSAAVPLLFFQPPTWLAGPSPCYVASLAYEKAYEQFHGVLEDMVGGHGGDECGHGDKAHADKVKDDKANADKAGDARLKHHYSLLQSTWDVGLPGRIDLALAVILQQHHHLVPAYYFSVFPRFHDITRSRHHMPPAIVARLLALDADVGGPLTRDVARRWRVAYAFRRHLDAAGLLIEYELAPETRVWLAERDGAHADMLEDALCEQQHDRHDRSPAHDFVRMLLESVLQASIQPRNVEPLLNSPVLSWAGAPNPKETRKQQMKTTG